MADNNLHRLHLRFARPDFQDLPWNLPLASWPGNCPRLEEAPRGLSRHPVVFVNYSGSLYAIKEMPAGAAEKEYALLLGMEAKRLPVVSPLGYVEARTPAGSTSLLITRYLERSIPFRSLFMRMNMERYRGHLLDAIAGLLVQVHLSGFYWGDCSLSNTLFRRDAGALQAYLVDAETAESFPEGIQPAERFQDLQIMEVNVNGDLSDLFAANLLPGDSIGDLPLSDTGAYIRRRYLELWEQVTHEDIINPGEHYRIQERIRQLNLMGFSVGEIELLEGENGNQLRLRVFVTDRNFHRDQLHSLTGIDVEERQARQMMNEIQELKATLSAANNRSTPLSVASYYWLENIYQPTIERLGSLRESADRAELYCQLLEHKWYLSEKAQHDIGHRAAVDDFLQQFSQGSPA